MIDESIIEQRDTVLKKIDTIKGVPEEKKIIYKTLLMKSAAATNGVSRDEKLQSCCENQFGLVLLYAIHACDAAEQQNNIKNSKFAILADVIEKCKWQVTIICFFIAVMIIYHPEIINVIKSFF